MSLRNVFDTPHNDVGRLDYSLAPLLYILRMKRVREQMQKMLKLQPQR